MVKKKIAQAPMLKHVVLIKSVRMMEGFYLLMTLMQTGNVLGIDTQVKMKLITQLFNLKRERQRPSIFHT